LLDQEKSIVDYYAAQVVTDPPLTVAMVRADLLRQLLRDLPEGLSHEITPQNMADKTFLGITVWRESRGEPVEVQTGVACVVLNRVHRPSWWGRDVMSVLFKKWQFSSLTDPKDRQLTTWPETNDKSWQQCLRVACDVIDGKIKNPVPGADSYYDISIPAPNWATKETFVAQLGRVRFYNLDKDIEVTT
jgi:spore germination cell wall hydrolase CwlJ-like protein